MIGLFRATTDQAAEMPDKGFGGIRANNLPLEGGIFETSYWNYTWLGSDWRTREEHTGLRLLESRGDGRWAASFATLS